MAGQGKRAARDLIDWLGIRDAPDWTRARWLGAGVGVVLALLFLLAFGAAFVVLGRTILQAGQAEAAGPNLGAGALITALLGAPFVIWGTWLKYQTVRYQKEGHITDRITTAVEQLGAEKTVKVRGKDAEGKDITIDETRPNIEVRIGAILSLERIAQDSTLHDKGRDHVRVMEILCAYVRENSKAPASNQEDLGEQPPTPRLDLQMTMDVIKRRGADQRQIEADQRYRLDLRRTDFRNFDLTRGSLAAANLAECRFEHANFEDSDLRGSRFGGSVLNHAFWRGADLTGANLDDCVLNLPEPTLGNLAWTTPSMATVKGVSVIGADLTAMDYFPEDRDAYFGSGDTKLNSGMEHRRQTAQANVNSFRRATGRETLIFQETVAEDLRSDPFANWVPYGRNDGAIGYLRSKWRTRLGLTEWPYVG